MDPISHFRSLDDLIRTLDRERKLLMALFQDRKRLSFRRDIARDLASRKDESLDYLRRFGVIRDNGDFVELEDMYMKFFEEVLEVNEEISVASVKESIDNLNAAIEYYQNENNPNRKYGYLKDVKRILRNIAYTTTRNVIDLKRNIDNTYKNEPTFSNKKKKLIRLDEKRKDIAALVNECERVIDEKQATFFIVAMDVQLRETVTDVKLQLRDVYHNLLELDRQIISYLNLVEYQNRLFEKLQKLKYLYDQKLLETNTDVEAKMDAKNPVWMEPRPRYPLKASLTMLRTSDIGLLVLKQMAKGKGNDRLLDELQQKFDTEKSGLNQEQGVVNDQIKRLKERKEYYATQRIEDVLKRYANEQILRGKLEEYKARLAEITTCFNDVTAKYKALSQSVKNQLENYRQAQNNRIIELKQENQQTMERMLVEYSKKRDDVDAAFADKILLATQVMGQLKDEQVGVEKEILKLKYWQPYKDELDGLHQNIEELALREKELDGLIATSVANINQLQAQYDKQEAAILANANKLLEAKQQEIDETTKKLTEIEKLLSRTKGSLYEWLKENKHDWEQNIGKVIDEENVLYQTGLHPEKGDGTSCFGVKLDITDLPLSVRKPTQLKEEKTHLDTLLRLQKNEYASLQGQQEKQVEELKHQFSPKMKELRFQKSAYETELRTIPQKRKAIQVKMDDYVSKAKQEVEQRSQELKNRQQENAQRRTEAETELAKVNTDKQKQLANIDKQYQKAKVEAIKLHEQQVAEIRADIKQQEQKTDVEFQQLQRQELEELHGRGADTRLVEECQAAIRMSETELKYIEEHRRLVFEYHHDKEEFFDREDEFKAQKKLVMEKLQQLSEKYQLRRQKYQNVLNSVGKELSERFSEKNHIDEELQKADRFAHDEKLCPPILAEGHENQTLRSPGQTVEELTGIIVSRQSRQNQFKGCVNVFKGNFSAKNTFHFRMELNLDDDYLAFANNLDDFLVNNMIEEYRRRTSERYVDILARISKDMGELTRHESDVHKVINDINNDFRERNFAGVIKLIALQSVPSADKMVQLMKRIKDFHDENQFAMGELNLFSSANRDDVNQKAVDYLLDFMKSLLDNPQRQLLSLSDLFQLKFRIIENDNDTGWADKLSHVGSEGTDTLVKAMVNIMLINVFKEKVSRKFGDFRIHCMMDEIGKLHPQNVKGILDFANARNILLINSSPTTYNVSDYRYTYLLSKDGKSQTVVHPLISQKETITDITDK